MVAPEPDPCCVSSWRQVGAVLEDQLLHLIVRDILASEEKRAV